MRVLLVIITLFGIQSAVFAGNKTDRFELAKQAHLEKRFSEAIDLLEKEIKVQPNNAALYFNLGLSYKAEKEYPKAIWAFEKTLKLQPKDSEAIQLIEACYTELDSDMVWRDEAGTFQRTLIALGSNFWSYLAVLFSIIAATGIIMAKRTKKHNHRKWYVGMAVFAVITLFLSVANAYSSHSYENNHDYAIILDNFELSDNSVPSHVMKSKFPAGRKIHVEKWHKDGSASIQALGKTVKVQKGLARI
ncbi:MAG: tetratricopeptide repeat protein [Crocinitomicaceae bacterium]